MSRYLETEILIPPTIEQGLAQIGHCRGFLNQAYFLCLQSLGMIR